jgi:tRNA A37 threonylcarbamoyladenosine biosynthesis protein TsaE
VEKEQKEGGNILQRSAIAIIEWNERSKRRRLQRRAIAIIEWKERSRKKLQRSAIGMRRLVIKNVKKGAERRKDGQNRCERGVDLPCMVREVVVSQ